jgi:hypothetical protein
MDKIADNQFIHTTTSVWQAWIGQPIQLRSD